jgi:hypothetical protein
VAEPVAIPGDRAQRTALISRRTRSANPTWLVAPIAALGAGFIFANLGPYIGVWRQVVGPGALVVTAGLAVLGLVRGSRRARLVLKNGILSGVVGNQGYVQWPVRDLQSRVFAWVPSGGSAPVGFQLEVRCKSGKVTFGARIPGRASQDHDGLAVRGDAPDTELSHRSFFALCAALGRSFS